MEEKNSLIIALNHIEDGLKLQINSKIKNTLFLVNDALENNESPYQLIEGCYYEYKFSSKSFFFQKDEIIDPSSFSANQGRISPNIYVGTFSIPIFKQDNQEEIGKVELEIQSIKSRYRDDYRFMLQSITEKCTDLLMQSDSPVKQHFETDFGKDSETLYQKFAFVNSIINSVEFNESVQRIVASPVTTWIETTEISDIRKAKRLTNSNIKELINGRNRTSLPEEHYLRRNHLNSVSAKINSLYKKDTVDTPENRFIKHALGVFLKFCTDIEKAVETGKRTSKEAGNVIKYLETHLHHSIFKEISRPSTLRLNSPILQRKEGYREILKAWLMFDLAAKLIWKGGEDVYQGGKKDIAVLYEYWIFFILLDLFKDIFEIEPKNIEDLIQPTKDGLNLQIKQGNHTPLRGFYNTGNRKLNVKFNYNRTFSGSKSYPEAGSWTKSMIPDYTLSIWPKGVSEHEAEIQELIVHIHFDAKYKIENLIQLIDEKENLLDEKIENAKGKYKNIDLLKMHAYKDAIRRTSGAYVLYPGSDSLTKKGFHEIIPGLGAFPIRPSRNGNGISELKGFIQKVIEHFINRASQRENIAFRTYDIHKGKPNELNESIPEAYGDNRNLIPDETHVLVGYFKDLVHYNWISSKGLYNIRIDTRFGAIPLTIKELSVRYILLHTSGDESTSELWERIGDSVRVYSSEKMIKEGYQTENSYLIFRIQKSETIEFNNVRWSFKELPNYESNRSSAKPFVVTLTELMKTKI